MSSTPDICVSCTETVPAGYVINTGHVYICGPDGITRDVGNVTVLDFTFRPNVVEHRRGRDGALDALLPISEDFMMVVTADEIGPALMSYILGVDMIDSVDGCQIPLAPLECDRKYAVQFLHDFRCSGRTLQIDFWSALINAEATMQFGTTPASIPINVRATRCDSLYPNAPYGQMLFSQTCPTS